MDSKLHILILEDDAADFELIEHELGQSGIEFEVRWAQDQSSFLRALAEYLPDLLIADYSLPGFDGLSAMELARQRYGEIPVIMVSGSVGEEQVIETLKSGATDYVLKQRLSRLTHVVRRSLHESQEKDRRQRAEAELRASEEKYRQLLDTANSIIIRADQAGGILYVNDYACRFFCYSRRELLGSNIKMLIPTVETGGRPLERLWEEIARDTKRFEHNENENVCKSGERVWVSWANRAQYDEQGRLTEILCIGNDITALKRTEESLRRSEAQLQAERNLLGTILDSIPAMITVCQPEHPGLEVNKEFERLTGWSAAHARDGGLIERCCPDPRQRERAERVFISPQPGWHDLQLRARDGSLIDSSWSTVPLAGGGLVSIGIDMRERRKAESETRRLLNEVTEGKRLLELLIESVPIPIAMLSAPAAIYTMQNRAMAQWVASRGKETVLGRSVMEVFEEGEPLLRPIIDEVLASKKTLERSEMPVPLAGKDVTETRYLSFSLIPILHDGEIRQLLAVMQDRTDQVVARRAIEELAARDEAVMNSLREGIVLQSPEGTFVYMNPAALRYHGLASLQEMRANPLKFMEILELIDMEGNVIPHPRWPVPRVMAGETVTDCILQVHRKDLDSYTYISYGGSRVYDQNGNWIYNLFTNNDVTELVTRTQEAEERKTFLDAILERAPMGILITRKQDLILKLQSRYDQEIFGDWVGKNVLHRGETFNLHRSESEEVVTERTHPLNRAITAGEVTHNEEWHYTLANGEELICLFNATPLTDFRGGINGAILVWIDITQRKRAEEKLAEERNFISRILDTQGAMVVLISVEAVILNINRAVETITGCDPEVVKGSSFWVFFEEQDVAIAREKLLAVVGNQTVEYECFVHTSDGRKRFISWRNTGIFDEAGRLEFIIATGIDITERLESENNIRRLNAELERRAADLAGANRDLEAFSYSVSHDLRAPLNVIGGFTEIIVRDYHGCFDEKGQMYLSQVLAGVYKMRHLIEDILSLSRVGRQEMRRQRVDLSCLVRDCLAQLRASDARRQVEFLVQPDVQADADPHLIQLALQNLLANAWKFTSRKEQTRIEFGAFEKQGQTVYFVKDNGAGFDMRLSQSLFEPFKRLHGEKEYGGSGVGLSIVQRVFHRHGGSVWAEAEVGKGATFFFTLGSAEA
jgi:PAS domain S-box-containing protein